MLSNGNQRSYELQVGLDTRSTRSTEPGSPARLRRRVRQRTETRRPYSRGLARGQRTKRPTKKNQTGGEREQPANGQGQDAAKWFGFPQSPTRQSRQRCCGNAREEEYRLHSWHWWQSGPARHNQCEDDESQSESQSEDSVQNSQCQDPSWASIAADCGRGIFHSSSFINARNFRSFDVNCRSARNR